MYAQLAERPSRHMAIRIEFIALVLVLQRDERRGMGKEMYENVMGYRLAMSMAKEMLSRGIISEEEFVKIETKMCEKYCINLSSIFRYNGSK